MRCLNLNRDDVVDLTDQTLLVEGIFNTVAGDTDLDGDVDFADFLIVSANFGKPNARWSSGDFNGDAVVSFPDFLALSAQFGVSRNVEQIELSLRARIE